MHSKEEIHFVLHGAIAHEYCNELPEIKVMNLSIHLVKQINTRVYKVSNNRYLQNNVMNNIIINLEGGGLSPQSPLPGSAPGAHSFMYNFPTM